MHTILVADDSVTIQKAVEIVFDKEPFRVVKAGSGAEAIAKTRELKPNLVLVDHMMGDKNGYEIAEALHNDPSTSSIPVVILSGNAAPYDEARARAAGVVANLPKPFDCQTLLERVRTLLGVEATVHGSFGPSAPAASALSSSMPRPPGAPGAMPRPPAVGAPRPAIAVPSRPVTAAEQSDPFGFGGAMGNASSPVAEAPRPTPATSFASNPFGGSSATVSSPPVAAVSSPVVSSPPMASPPTIASASISSPPVSSSAAFQAKSPLSSALSTSVTAKPTYAEAEFDEADLEADVGLPVLTPSTPSNVSGVPSAAFTSASSSASSHASGNGADIGQTTAKVDTQRLASLDAASADAAPMARAVDAVVERASAAIAQTNGQPPSREVLGQEAREIVERIAWEIIPELAEVIIREEIQRLLKSR